MNRLTKRTLLCVGLILYFGAYVAVRMNEELVHRHTWDSGWSKHWIVPARTDGEARLAFVALVLSEDPMSKEVQERIFKEVEKIDRRRRVFQCIFIPLVVVESAAHWVVNPRV